AAQLDAACDDLERDHRVAARDRSAAAPCSIGDQLVAYGAPLTWRRVIGEEGLQSCLLIPAAGRQLLEGLVRVEDAAVVALDAHRIRQAVERLGQHPDPLVLLDLLRD